MAIDTKDILDDIEIAIEKAADEHMADQPYECKCSVCKENLVFQKVVDSDKDLLLTIEPCETCMETAANE